MKLVTSALTSAKTNGASYLNVSSPSLIALTGTGPQQYTPEEKCQNKDDRSTLLRGSLEQIVGALVQCV